MEQQSTIVERLRFSAIGDEAVDALREAKEFIIEEMPPILDAFYDHVGRFPETAAFFRSREHMMHAKAMQVRHWTIIVDGRLDERYVTSVTRIGETHHKLGLEPRWYIGGYSHLISGMLAAIGARYGGRRDGAKRIALQQAFVKAALLDMDFAISVYLDSGQRDRVAAMAESFEQGIGQVYARISAAATELKASAASLASSAREASGQSAVVAAAAEQTAANVQTIAAATEELSASAGETAEVVKAIETISGTIQRIDEISGVIASSVDGQGAATAEIAQNVQQAAIGTQEVSTNITSVNRAAAETGRVSAEIAGAANDLDSQATHLKSQMDQFVIRVRAA